MISGLRDKVTPTFLETMFVRAVSRSINIDNFGERSNFNILARDPCLLVYFALQRLAKRFARFYTSLRQSPVASSLCRFYKQHAV